MKVPAITMLMVVLTTEALPSALIWAPMARSGENQPTATVEEGLSDPKAAQVAIEKAFLEEEKGIPRGSTGGNREDYSCSGSNSSKRTCGT